MNAAEDRLSELMDAATCALDPPIEALLAGGERLGRARRRRRHIAVGAGTAAVVLLAGVGVAAGMRDTNPGDSYGVAGHQVRPPQSLGPLPASPVPSLTLSSSFPVPRGPRPGEVPINAAAAFNILRKLVPASWTFGAYLPSSPGWVLRVNVDDGKGVAQSSVRVAAVGTSGMDPVDCAKQGYWASATPSISPISGGGASPSSNPAPPGGFTSGAPVPECFVEGIDDGAGNAMVQVITAPPSKIVVDRVIANQATGVAVEITVQNGDPKSGANAVTRTLPPGTIDKWNSIAIDHMWQLYVPAALAK